MPAVAEVTIYAAALLVSALSLAAVIAYRKDLVVPQADPAARATLILPLTGQAEGLERLLAALDSQTLLPRRLLIAVETDRDPAFLRANQLSKSCAFPIEIVLAGLADSCAQKCWNQIAALRRVDTTDDAVVFLDADIVPQPWWLSAIVSPILDGTTDIVTGYRWLMVERQTLGAHFIAAIDRSIAVLPRFSWARGTWGGTLAFSRSAITVLDLEGSIRNAMTEDCVIGDRAAALGLRVIAPRALRVPTPMRSTLADAWRFGRRQFQIIRIYRPKLWWLAFAAITVRLTAWGAIIGSRDHSAASLSAGIALVALSFAGTRMQHRVASRLRCADAPGVHGIQYALAFAKPLVDLFYWTIIVAAIGTGTVTWGHVRYKVSGPFAVRVERRMPWF